MTKLTNLIIGLSLGYMLGSSVGKSMREINDVTSPTDILCPNCMKDKLVQYSSVDLSCTKCGYEFIKIDDNTVRFK